MNDMLRQIPKVDRILNHEKWQGLRSYPQDLAKEHLRDILDEQREEIKAGKASAVLTVDAIIEETARRTAATLTPALRRVINATGVVIHTNLGRAPLARSAIVRLNTVATGYSNLEYSLEKGERGDRYSHCVTLLKRITGGENALVVNNNAAAVLLILNTLAEGKEVIISRGELIEIGGSFRIPEVMKKSGALLREVGTTNRTFDRDYVSAINEKTGLIMKAHTSNYRIRGFTHEVTSQDLSAIGAAHGVPFYFDAGSGLFSRLADGFDSSEPLISEEMAKGIDVVSFSGDKLLGGPQAGIIIGKNDLIEGLSKNALTRALRPDKFTLVALEETLRLYLDEASARREIPILRMLYADGETLKQRAKGIYQALRKQRIGAVTKVVQLQSEVGGGSLPDVYVPSGGLSVQPLGLSVAVLDQALRSLAVPVVGRIEKDRFLIDVRTVQEGDEKDLVAALGEVLQDGR